MKIYFNHFESRHHESGMATMLFIMLLAIMLVLVTSNVRTIAHLHLTEKLIEQKQIQRLNATQTNTVHAAEQSGTR